MPLIFIVKRPAIGWRLLVAYGLIQFALRFGLLFGGMKLGMSAGLSSLIIQLQAFFTAGLAVLLLHERPTAAQMAGGAIGLAGMLLVATHIESRATLIGFTLVVAPAWRGRAAT